MINERLQEKFNPLVDRELKHLSRKLKGGFCQTAFLFYIIAFRLQAFLHLPQFIHLSGLITATLFSSVIASCSHAFTHIPQAIQEVVQTFTTFGPL